jgi:tetratricopeptide (TPR) repeat protein
MKTLGAGEEAFNNGNAAADRGDYQEAISQFTQAIKLEPNFAVVYISRGVSYYNLRDNSNAIADYDVAIDLDPNFALAYCNRGDAYRLLGDLSKATADARKACELGDCSFLEFLEKEKLLRD